MRQQEGRSGWSTAEENLLFTQIEEGRSENLPLKTVFERVAAATGRKPNSVRNYYYARVKEQDLKDRALHVGAFVPFGEDEIRSLLRTVLSAQANGISVRACTLSMGEGDNKAMLRYQNKYRSLLKTKPQLVKEVVEELAREGALFDPYSTARPSRAGRPRKGEGVDAGDLGRALSQVDGLDGDMFLSELYTLAVAARGLRRGEQETAVLRESNTALRERVRKQDAEISAQQERFHTLLGMYRRLLGVNREFLGMSSISNMSALSGYVRDLTHSVAACEAVLREYNA
ncbi:MAG: hypothetical protein EOM66_05870 [Clostridia bacterium]|nr:hypothetical protein [Clostridia bacterium]